MLYFLILEIVFEETAVVTESILMTKEGSNVEGPCRTSDRGTRTIIA